MDQSGTVNAYACIHISTSHTHEHTVPFEYSVNMHICVALLDSTNTCVHNSAGQYRKQGKVCWATLSCFHSFQEHCESFSVNIYLYYTSFNLYNGVV